jgi:hypothetical protein
MALFATMVECNGGRKRKTISQVLHNLDQLAQVYRSQKFNTIETFDLRRAVKFVSLIPTLLKDSSR